MWESIDEKFLRGEDDDDFWNCVRGRSRPGSDYFEWQTVSSLIRSSATIQADTKY